MDPLNRRFHQNQGSSRPPAHLNITEETARFSLLRLISVELNAAGFTHVDHRSVIEDLEGLVSGFMDGIVHVAYEMSLLCRRSRPNVRDMIAACADQGIEIEHLNEMLQSKLPQDLNFELPVIRSMNPGDPTLDFLPSDTESDGEDANGDTTMKDTHDSILIRSTTKRLRQTSEKIGGLPHLPHLPARHTWRHTTLKTPPATVIPPAHLSRPSATPLPIPNLLHPEFLQTDEKDPNTPDCLGFLNQRIREARTVEQSLTHLVQPHSLLNAKSNFLSKIQQINNHETVEKYQVSESDVPIINFERDWYDNHLYPSKLKTNRSD